MTKKFPKRHNNHTLEEKSKRFFCHYLPEDWNVNFPDKDYGQDLNIEIAENGVYKGLEFIAQLKSSKNSNSKGTTDEKQKLKVSTYNYLWGNLRVVLLVKFVEADNEAYWILLKDVPKPNQENQMFTIKIPRQNRLSTLDWNNIVTYVRDITYKKLEAVRP